MSYKIHKPYITEDCRESYNCNKECKDSCTDSCYIDTGEVRFNIKCDMPVVNLDFLNIKKGESLNYILLEINEKLKYLDFINFPKINGESVNFVQFFLNLVKRVEILEEELHKTNDKITEIKDELEDKIEELNIPNLVNNSSLPVYTSSTLKEILQVIINKL